jgi:hypothetical protein
LDDISIRRALLVPAGIASAMIVLAAIMSLYTGVGGWRAFGAYLAAWSAATVLSVLIWVLVQVVLLFPTRVDNPLSVVAKRLWEPLCIAPLPAVIFPLFLGGYTWAKSSIPFAVGYGWEAYWGDLDRAIFGTDAWRWSHGLMPDQFAAAWTFYYAVGWGFVLMFSGMLISLFTTRRFAATYFAAMMLSWLIGGIGLALCMSAAGPVFAHIADPALAAQFQPLQAELSRLLSKDDLVLISQRYLEAAAGIKVAVKGGGISAMPSMHMATATIIILASWRTRWLPLAMLFWAMTFFGSVYLGYHYAVDAPVAALVAVLCWMAAKAITNGQSQFHLQPVLRGAH